MPAREHHLRHVAMFLLLAAGFVILTIVWNDQLGYFVLFFIYISVSLALVACVYLLNKPAILSKNANGKHSMWGWLLYAPYFLLCRLSFTLYRISTREPAHVTVGPNLAFGRRPSNHETLASSWVNVLDLAVELPAVRMVRKLSGYQSIPILDGTAPTIQELHFAIEWIRKSVTTGPTYVHCAVGHGRSACIIVGFLISIGAVGSVNEGVEMLRSLRHRVHLNSAQLLVLAELKPVGKN